MKLLLIILSILALGSAIKLDQQQSMMFQCFGKDVLVMQEGRTELAKAKCNGKAASTRASTDWTDYRPALDILEELVKDSEAAERVYQGSRANYQQGSGDYHSDPWKQQSFDSLKDGPSTRQDYGSSDDRSWTRQDYGGRNRNEERSSMKQDGGFGPMSSRKQESTAKGIEFKASFVFPGDALANIFKLMSGMGPGPMSFGNTGPMSYEGQGPMSFEGQGPMMSLKSPRFNQFNGGYGSNDGGYAQSLKSLIETLNRNRRATGTEMEELVEKLKALRMRELMRRSNFTCTLSEEGFADENMNIDTYKLRHLVDMLPVKDQWLKERTKMAITSCVNSINAVPEEHYRGALDRNYIKATMLIECYLHVQYKTCPRFNAKKQLEKIFGSVSVVLDATGLEEDALLELTSKIL